MVVPPHSGSRKAPDSSVEECPDATEFLGWCLQRCVDEQAKLGIIRRCLQRWSCITRPCPVEDMMVLQATTITGQEQTSKDGTCKYTPVRPALLLAEQGIGFGFGFFAHGRLLVPATAEQPSLVGLCYTDVRDEFVTGEGVRVPERPRAIRSTGPLEEASPPQPFERVTGPSKCKGRKSFLPFGRRFAKNLSLSPLHSEPLAGLLARSTARRVRAPLAADERPRE